MWAKTVNCGFYKVNSTKDGSKEQWLWAKEICVSILVPSLTGFMTLGKLLKFSKSQRTTKSPKTTSYLRGNSHCVPEVGDGQDSPCPYKVGAKAIWPKVDSLMLPREWRKDTGSETEHPCCRVVAAAGCWPHLLPASNLAFSSVVSLPWLEPTFLQWFSNSLSLHFVSYLMTFQNMPFTLKLLKVSFHFFFFFCNQEPRLL